MRKDIQFRSLFMLKIPPYLKQGDKVAIIASARKIERSIVEEARSLLESKGYQVIYGHNLFKESDQFAGTDLQRARDFQEALNDDQIKAILCVRGGYGTIKMIGQIDWSRFVISPKWIVGYSDPTIFHNFLSNQGIASLHATMPVNYTSSTTEAIDALFNSLDGTDLNEVKIKNNKLNRQGIAKGPLVGGNLSMIYSTMGTPYQLNTRGKILFLEDLDEYLYHIDRMMMNLKLSGLLSHLKGLVIGAMTDMKDNPIPFGKSAEEIIKEAVSSYDYPVMFDYPAGHISDNRALKMACNYQLEVNEFDAYFSCKE